MSLLSFAKKIVGEKQQQKAAATGNKKPSIAKEAEGAALYGQWAFRIGLAPLVTEKSVALQEHNVVAFKVRVSATKGQIAMAVREKYNVEPLAVRTVVGHPKRRRRGYTVGMTNQWKKAYVTVKDIQSLHIAP